MIIISLPMHLLTKWCLVCLDPRKEKRPLYKWSGSLMILLALFSAGPCVNILKARCINCTFSQMKQSLHGYLVLECTWNCPPLHSWPDIKGSVVPPLLLLQIHLQLLCLAPAQHQRVSTSTFLERASSLPLIRLTIAVWSANFFTAQNATMRRPSVKNEGGRGVNVHPHYLGSTHREVLDLHAKWGVWFPLLKLCNEPGVKLWTLSTRT